MSYQKITIIGNCGSDPDMRYTDKGDPVCSLNVAANKTYFDPTSGQKVKETTWFRVATWGKLAENCDKFLQKGSLVFIEGELRPDKETGGPRLYTRQDGTVGASYEVTAHVVRFLSSPKQAEAQPADDENIPF